MYIIRFQKLGFDHRNIYCTWWYLCYSRRRYVNLNCWLGNKNNNNMRVFIIMGINKIYHIACIR